MKLFCKMAAILLAVVMAVPAAGGDLVDKARKQGRYHGVGWQNDGNHWSIEVLFDDAGAQIAYPSSNCSGRWSLTHEFGAELQYVEQIIDGTDNCIELGTVYLEPLEDGRFLYTWLEVVPKVNARAVLVPLTDKRLSYHELMMLTLNSVDMGFLLPEFRE